MQVTFSFPSFGNGSFLNLFGLRPLRKQDHIVLLNIATDSDFCFSQFHLKGTVFFHILFKWVYFFLSSNLCNILSGSGSGPLLCEWPELLLESVAVKQRAESTRDSVGGLKAHRICSTNVDIVPLGFYMHSYTCMSIMCKSICGILFHPSSVIFIFFKIGQEPEFFCQIQFHEAKSKSVSIIMQWTENTGMTVLPQIHLTVSPLC